MGLKLTADNMLLSTRQGREAGQKWRPALSRTTMRRQRRSSNLMGILRVKSNWDEHREYP